MLTHELTQREAAAVQLVGRLNQMSGIHLKELLFSTVTRQARDRVLARLVAEDYLMVVGRRAPGRRGGNSSTVYQLGRRGWWYLNKAGKYWGRRAVSEHSLIIADMFTRLVALDKDGTIKLLELDPEHSTGNSRADLYVNAGIPAIQKRREYYLEVQRSARPDVIRGKLHAYAETFEKSNAHPWPWLVFVVIDPYHKSEIARQVPKDMREWVRVWLIEEFFDSLVK